MADAVGEYLRSPLLQGIPHAFSLKAGLAPGAVLGGATKVAVRQVHSARVVTADEALAGPVEADALVTDRRGLLLTIVTADCAPILLADREAAVIGAAHAGWRGAHGGILAATIAAMAALGARRERIAAAIGPTIAGASYEVDSAFRRLFADEDETFFMAAGEGHFRFDLPAYCRDRLALAGVTLVDDLSQDTYTQPQRFHSFRRATHLAQPTTGRQTSAIALPLVKGAAPPATLA